MIKSYLLVSLISLPLLGIPTGSTVSDNPVLICTHVKDAVKSTEGFEDIQSSFVETSMILVEPDEDEEDYSLENTQDSSDNTAGTRTRASFDFDPENENSQDSGSASRASNRSAAGKSASNSSASSGSDINSENNSLSSSNSAGNDNSASSSSQNSGSAAANGNSSDITASTNSASDSNASTGAGNSSSAGNAGSANSSSSSGSANSAGTSGTSGTANSANTANSAGSASLPNQAAASAAAGTASSSSAYMHNVDISSVTCELDGKYSWQFIQDILNGKQDLYYNGDAANAESSLSEVVSFYCDMNFGIDYYEIEDETGTYLEIADEYWPMLQNTVSQAASRWNAYPDYVASACRTLNLNTTDEDLVNQINQYICTAFDYEVTHSSMPAFIQNKRGQCWHYAKLFADMCNTCGIEAWKEQTTAHAWDAVRIDGKVYWFDPTRNDTCGNTSKYSWLSYQPG